MDPTYIPIYFRAGLTHYSRVQERKESPQRKEDSGTKVKSPKWY